MSRKNPLLGIVVILGVIGFIASKLPGSNTDDGPSPAAAVAPAAVVVTPSRVPVQPKPDQRSAAVPPPASVPAPREGVKLAVKGTDVAFRSDPSKNGEILDRLPHNLIVEEVDRQDGWVKVRHPTSARTGWVFARYLGPIDEKNEGVVETDKKPPRPQMGPVLSHAAIARLLIQESLANYPSNCACPYNTDRRGHNCGQRSAYSRPGGYAPLCYPSDITSEMIAQYRESHAGR